MGHHIARAEILIKCESGFGLGEAGRGITLRGDDFSDDDPGGCDPAWKAADLGDLDTTVGRYTGIFVVAAQGRKVGAIMERIGKADLVFEIFRVFNGLLTSS